MESSQEDVENLNSSCSCHEVGLHNPHRLPRPPDESVNKRTNVDTDSQVSDDSDVEMKISKSPSFFDSPSRLLLNGQVIVPKFSPQRVSGNDTARLGQSQGTIGIQRRAGLVQNDLVWIGSSQNTMHMMNQVPIHKLSKSGSRISTNDIKRSPSNLSKQLSSCRYSSLTMSDTGTDLWLICRICQMPDCEKDPLITPCRCSGSMRYIHTSCLKKWMRISQRRTRKQPPRCELCHYQFMRHKQFKFSQWKWPRVRRRDKCLHIVFLLNLLIMIGCAIATVMCFLSDRDSATKFPKNKAKLTTEEVITLTCGVMFFVAFFIAMTVEIKARHTLYKLFLRFLTHNTEWTVEQYDPSHDPLFKHRMPACQV
ncbi:MARH1-like protein [Mya arenaria]|uniref:MARH1-like protein n=2 Tax=Mya arenaria TaxID=6604 RepID=A0ABY7FQI6_MYAAR|nr:E3 ubiquitin-protein ligase MARCHF8-like isoform X2 [Mya arenaria]WAR22988.1 MARH1-like protein [Mya arenaria]